MIRRPPISTRTDTLFPYTPLFRSVEALAQDTILERGFVSETVDPVAGRIRIAETPLRFSGRFADREILPAPMLGEHTRETLTRILGYPAAEVEALIAESVIAEAGDAAEASRRFVDRKSTSLNASH